MHTLSYFHSQESTKLNIFSHQNVVVFRYVFCIWAIIISVIWLLSSLNFRYINLSSGNIWGWTGEGDASWYVFRALYKGHIHQFIHHRSMQWSFLKRMSRLQRDESLIWICNSFMRLFCFVFRLHCHVQGIYRWLKVGLTQASWISPKCIRTPPLTELQWRYGTLIVVMDWNTKQNNLQFLQAVAY